MCVLTVLEWPQREIKQNNVQRSKDICIKETGNMGRLPRLSDICLQNHTPFSDGAYASLLDVWARSELPFGHETPYKFVQRRLPEKDAEQQAYALVKELVCKEQQQQKRYHDQNMKELKVNVGDKVWLRDFIVKRATPKKFHQPWIGPYEVTKVVGENNVEILMPKKNKRIIKRVNMEHIKFARDIDGKPEEIVKVHCRTSCF